MKTLWLLCPLALLPTHTLAQSAFSYDSVQVGYYQGQIYLGELQQYVSTHAATLRYSKTLGGQFYAFARAGIAQLEENFAQGPAQVRVESHISELQLGVGRYFTLSPSADLYLSGALTQTWTDSEVSLQAYGVSQRQQVNDTIAQVGGELGVRYHVDTAQRLEITPYYYAARDEQANTAQSLGIAFGLTVSPRLQLRGAFDKALNVEKESRGAGISLRLLL